MRVTAAVLALALSASALVAPSGHRRPSLLRSSPAAEDVAPAEPAPAPPAPVQSTAPGKQVIDDITLAKQSTALDKLAASWDRRKEFRSWEASRMTGFSEEAEIINGRTAMFFLVVGLLTEYWTGQSIPDQVFTMLRVGSFIGPDGF